MTDNQSLPDSEQQAMFPDKLDEEASVLAKDLQVKFGFSPEQAGRVTVSSVDLVRSHANEK